MSTQPSPTPVPFLPGGQPQDPLSVAMMFQQQMSGGGQAPTNVVPLWIKRASRSGVLLPAGPSARKPGDRRPFLEGNDAAPIRRTGTNVNPLLQKPESIQTQDYAESYWIDMTDEEREAFVDKARKAGAWEPSDGNGAMVRVWADAVAKAASYNSSRPQDQWLSPWEVMDRLYAASVAEQDGVISGYTGWREQTDKVVTNFSEAQIAQAARDILQRELGRDPSDEEIRAYTIAANRAAKENPQTVVTRTRDTEFDAEGRPINTETQREVQGNEVDPSQLIDDAISGTDEWNEVKAATLYMPALMNALGSTV